LKNSFNKLCTFGILVDPPTRTTSWTWPLVNLESSRTCLTGFRVDLNKSIFNSSNLALVKTNEKSIPSYKFSISILSCCKTDKALLARSASFLNLVIALLSLVKSLLFFFLKTSDKNWVVLSSKSEPPRWVSPLVAMTSKTFNSIDNIDTSNVPPPRSKTMMFFSSFILSNPYAIAAAVGSLIILKTFNPAILPASFVACLWESLKYAGTVTTALTTFFPR